MSPPPSEEAYGTRRKIGLSLRRFLEEHGTPNSAACSELETLYGGVPGFVFGWHWQYYRPEVVAACRREGVLLEDYVLSPDETHKLIRCKLIE